MELYGMVCIENTGQAKPALPPDDDNYACNPMLTGPAGRWCDASRWQDVLSKDLLE
jgi:hypothetical protein